MANHSVVATYGSRICAEAAVLVLEAAGIDTGCLSIVGGDVVAAILSGIGFPTARIRTYERELHTGMVLVLAHGSHAMVEHAGRVFRTTRASELVAHVDDH